MLRRTWGYPFSRLLVVFLLVAGSLALRLWLERWCPPNRFTYSSFYMAVVLSSYFLGTAEAILTSILSVGLAYWAFVTPAFSWKADPVELISMASFGLTSAVDIYFITAMKRAVGKSRTERHRFEILAEGHAALFHDYNERIAKYLSLLSIILERTKHRVDTNMLLIDEASRQAFTLSSLHRSQLGVDEVGSDFLFFSKQLLENLARTAGAVGAKIRTAGDNLPIPSNLAALLAIILTQWTHQALPSFHGATDAEFDVGFRLWDDKLHLFLRIKECRGMAPALPDVMPAMKIVDVIVDHLGGRSYMALVGGALSFELVAPVNASTIASGGPPHIIADAAALVIN